MQSIIHQQNGNIKIISTDGKHRSSKNSNLGSDTSVPGANNEGIGRMFTREKAEAGPLQTRCATTGEEVLSDYETSQHGKCERTARGGGEHRIQQTLPGVRAVSPGKGDRESPSVTLPQEPGKGRPRAL